MSEQAIEKAIFNALVKFQEHQVTNFEDNLEKLIPVVTSMFEKLEESFK